MSRPLRWVLVGPSDIAATRMIPAMRALGHQPVAVLSGSPERGREFAARHGVPTAAETLGEALSVPADAVYISTTNGLQCDQAVAAAGAGPHVLCEKPIAMTLDNAADLVHAARDAGVVLGINHHLRPSPVVQRLVADGAVGRPLAGRVDHAVALPEGLQGWRLSSAVKRRHQPGGPRRRRDRGQPGVVGEGIEDAVMAVLRLDGDILACIHDAFTVPNAGTALEVRGTEASVFASNAMTQDADGDVLLWRGGKSAPVDVGARQDLCVTGLQAFADAVRGEDWPLAEGVDGFASLAFALAVRQALTTGTPTPVTPMSTMDGAAP
ncbi:Gfo/Idh/MocA family oxidoreductase [Streptomyces sp. NBC_00322]|uniref:Gfo/Idh/MocA family protein n=1 Tax=Streptomyces sp. NBC_00322 TaxID=2975712 RepID=UPI002E2E6D66|nr:Gfo/Idh/MocA family oxidoreductase [Streptomyces sp. NBC_00322]